MSFEDLQHAMPEANWENHHRSQRATPRRHLRLSNDGNPDQVAAYRRTAAAMQGLVAASLEQDESLRFYGGAWSFSNAAVSSGTMVNTRDLNHVFSFAGSQLHASYPLPATGLFLVQCGRKIAGLNLFLSPRQRSLRTCGASNGQTIAGALSTGTHGAGIRVGAVSDFVVALHLVVGPQRQVWIERQSRPIVRDDIPAVFGAELIRSDSLFEAALVSFNSFGLIAGAMIETDAAFFLQKFAGVRRYSEIRPALETLDFTLPALDLKGPIEKLFHFEVRINPFANDQAYLSTMYRHDQKPADAKPLKPPPNNVSSEDLVSLVARLSASQLIAMLLGTGLASGALGEKATGECGTLGEVFRDTDTPAGGASTAMGVPIEHVNIALAVLTKLHQQSKAPVAFALRYVKATRATLGFTCHGQVTCVLEIDGVDSERTQEFFRASWAALREKQIPLTWHWGKMHDLDAIEKVRTAYGNERVDRWLDERRRLLPTAELRAVFANAMVERAGLGE